MPKRAIIGGCKLEIVYQGMNGGLASDDPKAVSLILPDGGVFLLAGELADDIKAQIWVSGGWLWRAEMIEEVEEVDA